MTRVLHRTVPLLLLATLLLSANPVQSGGRDVPETQSTGSGSSTAWPDLCPDEPTLIWIEGVPFTVSLNPDGSTQLEPTLSGLWDYLVVEAARLVGFGGADEGSCP